MQLTTDAVSVWRSGRTQNGRAKASKVLSADDAMDALASGVDPVFVQRDDAPRVLAWVRAYATRGGMG